MLVFVGVMGLWLASGVRAADAALFVAYHVTYVIGPGWVVYRLLRPGDTVRVRQLAVGWALGYVIEVLTFAATAAISARWLLSLYPLAFVALGVGFSARVRARPVIAACAGELPSGWGWVVAGLCLLALAFLAVEFFAGAPLPDQVGRVSYGIDTVWYLSLAGEALHHWPVGDPTVSGQPLFYHLFATFDCAAITQVTGIGLPIVFFRLCMVPMVVLAVLGIAVAGAAFGGAWTGPIAVVLALFVGELNLDPHVGYKFANEFGDDIVAISPSFLMGAALFAPALALLCELGWRARTPRLSYGALAAFALLVIGAAGAKAPTAPVLAAGLALYLLWQAMTQGELDRSLLAALGITLATFAFFLLFSRTRKVRATFFPPR